MSGLKANGRPADAEGMTDTPRPSLLALVATAIVILALLGWVVHAWHTKDTAKCHEHPFGPGCWDGQVVDDPIAEDLLKGPNR